MADFATNVKDTVTGAVKEGQKKINPTRADTAQANVSGAIKDGEKKINPTKADTIQSQVAGAATAVVDTVKDFGAKAGDFVTQKK